MSPSDPSALERFRLGAGLASVFALGAGFADASETPPSADSSARAEPAPSQLVLLLPSVDAELEKRLQGYLVGTAWRTRRAADASGATSLRDAQHLARVSGAGVAVFCVHDGARERLLMLDVQRRQLLERELRRSADETPEEASVRYEAAALIVASALERISQGRALADEVSNVPEPTATAAPAPSGEKTSSLGPSTPPASTRDDAESLVRTRLHVPLAAADPLRIELSFGKRFGFGLAELGVIGSLPRSVETRLDDDVNPRVDVRLHTRGLGAGGRLAVGWELPGRVRLEPSLGLLVLAVERKTTAVTTEAPAETQPEGNDFVMIVESRGGLELWSPAGCTTARCGLRWSVGAQGLVTWALRRPNWVVGVTDAGEAREVPVDEQWAPVSFSAGVGAGLSWP